MAAGLATAEATGIPTGTVARIVVMARTTTPVTIPTGMRKPSGLAIGSVLLASLFISFPSGSLRAHRVAHFRVALVSRRKRSLLDAVAGFLIRLPQV
jgi:hypothetical protein